MRRIAVLAVTAALLGCRETSGPLSPASLQLSRDSVVVYVDSTTRVQAIVRDAAGDSVTTAIVTWTIDDTTIANVTLGHVSGLRTGVTELVASVDSFVMRVTVHVIDRLVALPAGGTACFLAQGGRPYCASANPIDSMQRLPTARHFERLYDFLSGGPSGGHCGITSTHALWCWGDPVTQPVVMHQASPLYSYRQVASSCALSMQGQLLCWGVNAIETDPQVVAPAMTFKALASGNTHYCAVTTTGETWCWGGSNGYGQLGVHGVGSYTAPVRVAQAPPADTVIAGHNHTCILTPTHETWCWGLNYDFQVGDTTGTGCWHYGTMPVCTEVPVRVAGGLSFVSLTASEQTTCGMLASGALYCWGLNSGSYGDGNTSGGATPRPAGSGRLFRSVTASWSQFCGLALDDRVYCWGGNARVPQALPHQP